MRVGLVGLGSIGRRHLGNLLSLGTEVVAMDISADARSRAEAEHPHVKYVPAIPLKNLDALVIATPYDNHLGWVEECVKRSIPFLVEKPLGSLEQLPRWRELSLVALPVHMVGYNWRFNPEVVAWWQGWMGNARALFLRCDTDVDSWPGASYGDPALECSHELNLMQMLYEPSMEHRFGMDIKYHAPISGRWYRAVDACGDVHSLVPSQSSIDVSYRDEMAAFLKSVNSGVLHGCRLSWAVETLETLAAGMGAAA